MTDYHDRLQAGHYQPTPEPEETTVADLKAMLKDKGLPTTGTKDELIERLSTDVAENS